MEEIQEQAQKAGVTLPPFAIWGLGVFLTAATATIVPWGTWITARVMAHDYRMEVVDDNARRVRDIEAKSLQTDSSMRIVEATRFTAQNGRDLVAAVEQRLDRLEDKFDLLRRDLDRKGFSEGSKP